jgi:hypothetical protein
MFLMLLLGFSFAYSNNKSHAIKAEYCIFQDTNIQETSIIPSRWQLRITNLIENLDIIKLSEVQMGCFWNGTEIMIEARENIMVKPFISSAITTSHNRFYATYFAFLNVNPRESYNLSKKEYTALLSILNRNIQVKWIQKGSCHNSVDSISGSYYIKIKGECTSDDLKWNSEYDIYKLPSPIDMTDFKGRRGEIFYDSLERKLFENKWID